MRDRLARIAVAAALGCASGSACAMTAVDQDAQCQVIGGEKLPAESGGAQALCEAVASALEAHAPGQAYRVEIQVLGPSRLAASVTSKDGRKVAQQKMASSDKNLTKRSFGRFADAIVAQLFGSAAKS
jgi:hypothetical protein